MSLVHEGELVEALSITDSFEFFFFTISPSGNIAGGFPTSPRREMPGEAEGTGPHLGCFRISDILSSSGPCSSGKSNLVNSNSGLEVDPLFAVILDFLSVRLEPSDFKLFSTGKWCEPLDDLIADDVVPSALALSNFGSSHVFFST